MRKLILSAAAVALLAASGAARAQQRITDPVITLPSIPPYAPASDPSAANVGGEGSGGGTGHLGSAPADGRNPVQFDYVAFCSSPGKDGQPRSPSWISNCLAGH